MATVNIEVLAQVDDAVRGLANTSTSLNSLQHANQDASGALGVFGVSLTSLNNPLTLIASTVKGAIDTTVEYAGDIRKLGSITGATAEESSRLITATTLVGVSTDSLTRGLDQAVKHGFSPTVAGLGELADKYNSFADVQARTEWGLKTFGKGFEELRPLLVQGAAGIKEMGAQADIAGTVMSQKDVQAAKDLQVSERELDEVTKGFALRLGNDLIPGLASAAKATELLLTWDKRLQLAETDHSVQVLKAADGYASYKTELERSAQAAGFAVDAEGNLIKVHSFKNGVVREVIQANYLLTQGEYEVARGIGVVTDASDRQASAMAAAATAHAHMADNISRMVGVAHDEAGAVAAASAAQAAAAAQALALGTATSNAAIASDSLFQSLAKVTTAGLATAAIKELETQMAAHPENAAAYQAAIEKIGLKAGLMTPAGIAAGTAVTTLGSLLAQHRIDPEQYATALDKIPEKTKGGVIPSMGDLGLTLDRGVLHFEDAKRSAEKLGTGLTTLVSDHVSPTNQALDEGTGTSHHVSKLIDWLGSAGLPLDTFGGHVSTLVSDHVSPANKALDAILTKIDNLHDKTVTITYVEKHVNAGDGSGAAALRAVNQNQSQYQGGP